MAITVNTESPRNFLMVIHDCGKLNLVGSLFGCEISYGPHKLPVVQAVKQSDVNEKEKSVGGFVLLFATVSTISECNTYNMMEFVIILTNWYLYL